MTPIHEMKTRKATWVETGAFYPRTDILYHGVFLEVDGREVGVVLRDQPEEVAKPLIDAITALPRLVAVLLTSGRTNPEVADSAWHTHECWDNGKASCEEQCTRTRDVLDAIGSLP